MDNNTIMSFVIVIQNVGKENKRNNKFWTRKVDRQKQKTAFKDRKIVYLIINGIVF